MLQHVIAYLCVAIFTGTGAVYVDPTENPYSEGALTVSTTDIPANVTYNLNYSLTVYHPSPAPVQRLSPVIFIPNGLTPGTWYVHILTPLATHGYVVVTTAACPTGDEPQCAGIGYEEWTSIVAWVHANLTNHIDAQISWDHMSMASHSAGAQAVQGFVEERPDIVKAVFYMEAAGTPPNTNQPPLPALFHGAEFAKNFSCSIPGLDFEAWYDGWKCPRVLLEVAGFGHCDVMSEEPRRVCFETRFCDGFGPDRLIMPYQKFMHGLASAFLNYHIQGKDEHFKYFTQTSLIPAPQGLVQHVMDMNCTVV